MTHQNSYTVHLPVKAYIKKYVTAVEGNPIHFYSSSMLCQIIRAYLQNRNKSGLSKHQMQTAVQCRQQSIHIIIPLSGKNLKYIGHHINPDNVVLINRFLEECFQRALRQFMKDYTSNATGRYKGYKDAYYSFAEHYGIDLHEDISYDGLKKLDQRSRKKIDKNLFTLVPSAQTPITTRLSA